MTPANVDQTSYLTIISLTNSYYSNFSLPKQSSKFENSEIYFQKMLTINEKGVKNLIETADNKMFVWY